MKFVVYYRVRGGTVVNRSYPEYPVGTDVKQQWAGENPHRIYLQHEDHAVYTAEFANAGMLGADESTQRQWLAERVKWLNMQVASANAARQAAMLPGTGGSTHAGLAPGDMTVDQHGRRGRVPHVPVEVFRTKPYSPDTTMDAVRDFCKGGGGSIPRSS